MVTECKRTGQFFGFADRFCCGYFALGLNAFTNAHSGHIDLLSKNLATDSGAEVLKEAIDPPSDTLNLRTEIQLNCSLDSFFFNKKEYYRH